MAKLQIYTKNEDSLLTFLNFKDAYVSETDYRSNIDFDSLCRYGVKCLDDSLLAIARNELIVIGAGAGVGKTTYAIQIAQQNATNGKKVALYNLEGGYIEAIQRIKWQMMITIYYAKYHQKGDYFKYDYREWVLNKDKNPFLMTLESEAYNELKEKLEGNLYLYDNPKGLNCKSFCESLVKLEGLRADLTLDNSIRKNLKGIVNLDLIVIDHLHYFSLTRDENEIVEITEILKTVKTITEEMQIPVILVVHLRKLPRGHGIPDQMDIYGTSNIAKIANTCIIIAPDHEKDDMANGIYPTFIRIAKSRQGLRPNLLMYVNFNSHERKYEENYQLYRCGLLGDPATEPLMKLECPRWYEGK